jgi:hypothetical protein
MFTRLFPVVLLLVLAPAALSRKPRPAVTFVSPVECHADHGKWRWKVKTEKDRPPAEIPTDHRITPSDVADWEPPEQMITNCTQRVGRQTEWYELTGRVTLVKPEEDGDLHIQLRDAKGGGRMQVVVEVPVDHGHPDWAWSNIRKTVFAWSNQAFPFTTKTGHRLRLEQRPVVRVVGRPFYDVVHGKKCTPNRRKGNPRITVWEIHPVMRLEVLQHCDRRCNRTARPGDSDTR